MDKGFYTKLAISNIKKNSRAYLPYILTNIGIIILFYNMCYLARMKSMGELADNGVLKAMMYFGTIITGLFAVLFLSYTNGFLIKQRKKEIGLFNILGMEKRHIAKIMFLETIIISLISIIAGILGGILFSKFMALLLFKIINFKVVFGFEIPIECVVITIILFGVVFMVNLIYNVLQVQLSKPIELLKGGNVGEKEPKTKWLQAIIGLVSLGIGYYLALSVKSPVTAIYKFFIAVIFVTIGTNNLFKAGSIVLLKQLRKNKKYYYKTNHFISVSGMIYRMKQNAKGLANICILSTAVIVTLSTTISLYVGVEDILHTRFTRNISITGKDISDEEADKINEILKEQVASEDIKNVLEHREVVTMVSQKDSNFDLVNKENFSINDSAMLVFITLEDYNRIENEHISLNSDEILIYEVEGSVPEDSIVFKNKEYNIKEHLSSISYVDKNSTSYMNTYFIIGDSIDTIKEIHGLLSDNDKFQISYYYGFDTDMNGELQVKLIEDLQKALDVTGIEVKVDGAEVLREGFYTLYGGLFFLGIFIGLLFLMATVLIMYYKQIAEGYDDKSRFEIMQKVGMSTKEIKRAINSQVLTVFYLPLVVAIIHIAFAFNVITKLLSIFNLTNITLYAICTAGTIVVFAIFYTIVYGFTARTYYKIVK